MGVAGPIVMRFELHRSPVGHTWRITIRDSVPGFVPPRLVFQGVRVAGDSGDLAVQRRTQDLVGADRFQAKADDAQTGQVCMAFAQV